ncbi:hypothetical protein [Rhodococcus olei]|uniref:hypothetical protein n=1 Tax=Rhodococcus olei TaxID=2161675 RepID=UPI0031E76A2F
MVFLVVGDLVVAVGAPLWNYYFQRSDTPLQAGAAVIGVITFTCVWLIQRDSMRDNPTTNSMRDAIAAAFVVTYLVMVGWSAFFNNAVHVQPSEQDALSPLTQTLISNFTYLTATVVVFYFGADTVKQVVQIRGRQATAGGEAGLPTAAPGPRDQDNGT